MSKGDFVRSFGEVVVLASCDPIETLTARFKPEALVSSDDSQLSMGGGVSKAIAHLAGRKMVAEARKQAPAPVGTVVTTSAGNLSARYIFHAVTVDWKKQIRPTDRTISELAREIFIRCEALQVRSLVIPALGTGAASFAADRSASFVVDSLQRHVRQETLLRKVVFSLPAEWAFEAFVRELRVRPGTGVVSLGPAPFEDVTEVGTVKLGSTLEEAAGEPRYAGTRRGLASVRMSLKLSRSLIALVAYLRSRSTRGEAGEKDAESHHERVGELFLKLRRMDPEARVKFLDREVANDPELRAELESLLAHDFEESFERPRTGGAAARAPEPTSSLSRDRAAAPSVRPSIDSTLLTLADSRPLLARRYVLLEEVGRGGMGRVHLAWDLVLRRTVAIKTLRRSLFSSEKASELLRREAAIAIDLTHDVIVRVYHFEPECREVGPFLVMEYLSWPTGQKWIADAGEQRLPARCVIDIGVQLCEGLAHAHDRGVLHGDIKPSNVFVDAAADRAKLTDFGLARVLSTGSRRALQLRTSGTPAYMAPEQLSPGAKVGFSADIYQLAATLWDFLTGEPPVVPVEYPDTVDDETRRALGVVSRGLAVEEANRPASARLVGEELAGCLG